MARALNPKSGRLDIRAEPEQIEMWASAAAAQDRPLASWLRRVATEAAEKQLSQKKRHK